MREYCRFEVSPDHKQFLFVFCKVCKSRPSPQRHGDSGSVTRVLPGGDWVEISEGACWHWDLGRKANWAQCWDPWTKASWAQCWDLRRKASWAQCWDLRRKASWAQCWDLRRKACWGRTHTLTNKPNWAYQENTNLESGLLWLSSYIGGGSLGHGITTICSYLQHCQITSSGNLYVQTILGVIIVASHATK